jgi:hypothetical protein
MRGFTITVPKTTVWESNRAHQFSEQLLFGRDNLLFRVKGDGEGILWQLADMRQGDNNGLANAIYASYPDADIRPDRIRFTRTATPVYRYLIKYQPIHSNFLASILLVNDIKKVDPLATLVQAMQLQAGEQVIVTLMVVGIATRAYEAGRKLIYRKVYDGTLLGLLLPGEAPVYAADVQHKLEAKLQQRLYQCLLTIQVETPNLERIETLLSIDNHMINFQHPEMNGFVWIPEPLEQHIVAVDTDATDVASNALGLYTLFSNGKKLERKTLQLRQAARLILSAEEIASLWHLPHEGFDNPMICWSKGGQVRLPREIRGRTQGALLGKNSYRGQTEAVHITNAERATHMHILGKTGTGKSTLLHHLIHQDIAAGNGVAVIDPHGKLVRNLLRTSIPPERARDVVVLDLANEEYPPPLNLLAVPKAVHQHHAAALLISILNKQGRFADTVTVLPALRSALITLWQEETPTIRDLVRLFHDEDYRQGLLRTLTDPAAQDFWMMYQLKKGGLQEQISSPIVTRMNDFYGNPFLYPMTCHPDLLDFATLIQQRKIILVSLEVDRHKVSDLDRMLLGSIVLFQLQTALMNGAANQHPFYLYLDEAHQFISTSLNDMLTELRKYQLAITLAHQYLGQLQGETLEAVVGTVGTLLTFQCGLNDARALAPYMKPGFTADDLLNLDLYTAAAFMRSDRQTLPAFNVEIERPLEARSAAKAQAQERGIRTLSIQQYTPKSRADVLQWLDDRYRRPSKVDDEEVLFDPGR